MPTYDYRCERCGVFEMQQRITELPLNACPTCGGPVRRLLSRNVSILYRGSGFHCTDYRPQEYKDKAKEESSKAETPSAAS
ncbi:MAG: zinc ribbon domain-containing protein [Clostridia bacterium]|nr:zinc ribbon domain-containing protein [Clostridia bacterium]